MKKMKEVLKSKYIRFCMVVACLSSALSIGACAAGEDATITTAFTTGFTKIASDAVGMIAMIVPIALGVAGTVFLVRKAMSWFKGLAK